MTTHDLRRVLMPTLFAFSLFDAAGRPGIGDGNPRRFAGGKVLLITMVLLGRAGGSEHTIRRTRRARNPVDLGRGLLL